MAVSLPLCVVVAVLCIRTNNGWPVWHQLSVKRVCHIYCQISGHIKKRNKQVSTLAGTQNVKKKSDMRVDRSLQKKMEKATNQHARTPHIGKAGTP